jgi:hypothetical protein
MPALTPDSRRRQQRAKPASPTRRRDRVSVRTRREELAAEADRLLAELDRVAHPPATLRQRLDAVAREINRLDAAIARRKSGGADVSGAIR